MTKAYFSAGCFWGVQYHFAKTAGVTDTRAGFMGGDVQNPSYQQVKTGETGHLETVEVTFNSEIVSYESLVHLFFEIHDFEQTDGQGPDIGSQYLSAIFFTDDMQKRVAFDVISELRSKGYDPATEIRQADVFYPAEEYHQHYYEMRNETPYCHLRRVIF